LRVLDDASDALCAAAAARVGDPATADALRHFRTQHTGHTQLLGEAGLRGTRTRLPEVMERRLDAQAQRVLTAQGDDAVLQALLDVELVHAERYAHAAAMLLPVEADRAVRQGLAEERAHVAWLQERVGPLLEARAQA
jgi:hypothetical protein